MLFMPVLKHQNPLDTLKAFSMLELLLSVFGMSVGLMTIVAVMSGSLRHSYDTRDAIIASGLAQEGVELVRNARDNNFDPIATSGNGFNRFTNKNHCKIDVNVNVSQNLQCGNGEDRPSNNPSRYYLQYTAGVYQHANSTKERFSRYINIEKNGNNANERATVRSFVYWGAVPGGLHSNADNCTLEQKCVFAESFLTAWKSP